jgi:hypothetical protein
MTPLPDRLRATVALALALAACSADPAATALDAGPPDAGPRGPLTLVGHAAPPAWIPWRSPTTPTSAPLAGQRGADHRPAILAPMVVGVLAPLEITELHGSPTGAGCMCCPPAGGS